MAKGVKMAFMELAAQHLVSLVQDKLFDVVGPQHLPGDHVKDTAGGANHDMLALLQLAHVPADTEEKNIFRIVQIFWNYVGKNI